MEVTKFTEDNRIGCTYGFDLIHGIYLKIWAVNGGIANNTPIKEYTDPDEWLIFNEDGKNDDLTPEDMQLVLDQHGFHKIGELNIEGLAKQHNIMIEAQEQYAKK